jgi:predicted PP-loop superfamily ATPase
MNPDHCKDVSLRHVDFPLTAQNIARNIAGKNAYTRTDFIILRHEEETAVIRVVKQSGKDLFRPISSHEIVSLPQDTMFIRDELIDVLNASQMARKAREHPGKTVVVSGMFNHVSFLQEEKLLDLFVVDVVPPSPSKLSVLVERAFSTGLVDLPIVPHYQDIDLNELEKRVTTKGVMFPCRASGLVSGRDVFFLDETPDLEGDITLIGCDLSKRIFHSVYRKDAIVIDMCPRNLALAKGKTLVKCCSVKEGFEIHGDVASVPWGATVLDVVGAINSLFGHSPFGPLVLGRADP